MLALFTEHLNQSAQRNFGDSQIGEHPSIYRMHVASSVAMTDGIPPDRQQEEHEQSPTNPEASW